MMGHFRHLASGIDVAPLVAQIDAHPELWNQHPIRKLAAGSPHAEMDDIWIRYNDYARLVAGRETFNDEHVPIWYPAARVLTAVRPILFNLMAAAQGEMLCGVFITRVPPGGHILPHVDRGWHAETTEKFYVALRSPVGAYFRCDCGNGVTETLWPEVGELHTFDNGRRHWVDNNSDEYKMTLIVAIRTEIFGKVC
jgi:hypothetical protein